MKSHPNEAPFLAKGIPEIRAGYVRILSHYAFNRRDNKSLIARAPERQISFGTPDRYLRHVVTNNLQEDHESRGKELQGIPTPQLHDANLRRPVGSGGDTNAAGAIIQRGLRSRPPHRHGDMGPTG